MVISRQREMWVAENRDSLSVSYRFYSVSAEVRARDKRLISTLNSIFAHFISEESGADLVIEVNEKTPGFSIRVLNGSNTLPFDNWTLAAKLSADNGSGAAYRVMCGDDVDDLLRNIYYTILSFTLINLDQFLQIHASTVARGQKGITFPGGSGSGKTTLALALTRAGYSFLADEITLIDPSSSTVLPFPRSVFLRQDIFDLFENLKVGRYRGDMFVMEEKKCLVEIRKSSVHPKNEPPKAGPVIFPKYSPGARALLEEISPADALARLVDTESILNFLHPGTDRVEVLDSVLSLLTAGPCYELTSSSTDDAVKIVDNLLGR